MPHVHKFSAAMFCLILLIVSGCSSNYPVRVYDGPTIPDDQVVVLKVPEDINVISIDGQKMTSYLLENLSIDYYLKPGPHSVVFQYSGIWSVPSVESSDGKANVELIESEYVQLQFSAKPGQHYVLQHETPPSRSSARISATKFKASVVDSNERLIATSGKYVVPTVSSDVVGTEAVTLAHQAGDAQIDVASAQGKTSEQAVQQPQSTQVKLPVSESLPTLDAMKVLWQGASKEEKKAFLKWAFQ
ncbi:hypothetical protein OLMES_0810 [Oleiphilus messinensis]|uniref:DUF2057 domain-containing protein n=1 Tax=Oleiphilus messinensis TaxID=141451 RepID=A0A1Y0I358_9GAMM|nr:DUF2057 family protein [Oleiphilus messinensis]ARU54902.1 hypothetical protein OLMES_0810 [Oleiphilus messinensis]